MARLQLLNPLLVILVVAVAGAEMSPRNVPLWGTQQTKPATQAPPPPAEAPKKSEEVDHSDEAVVVESSAVWHRYENDGTGTRRTRMRIRVQQEAGIQQLGQLVFPYSSANEKLEIKFVRVLKKDGSIVTAGESDILDLSAPVAREAPVYTDLREKHVTVPALRPGETLEYEIVEQIETPLAPGHFWLEHSFAKDYIVLNEYLEVNIPGERAVQLKPKPGMEPIYSEEPGRRVFMWTRSNTTIAKPDDEEEEPKEKKPTGPDVQLTTFKDWAEVGAWYGKLARERAAVTPEVRTRAEQLLAGRTTEMERVEGLYDYVAKNFRYVSLSFGVGRFQPHAASAVLANQYGDCKDKHTLLAALLEASGMRAYPVLISTSQELDEDVPSPAQFDHVITAIPTGDDLIWVDTTLEVAPFRLLAAELRNKQALVIPTDGPARVMKTPADPPFPTTQRVEVKGVISPLGKLTAQVKYELRGDVELLLRLAFRRTPPSKWKELGQLLAWGDGLRGEVTLIRPSDPADTSKPFQIEYDVAIANFLEWTRKRSSISIPLPSIGMPIVDGNAPKGPEAKPIELGTPADIQLSLRLEWPETVKFRAPVAVGLTRDYAEYRSTYKLEGTVLTAERSMRFLMRELPASRASDYLAFQRAINTDASQRLEVEILTAGTDSPAIPESVKTKDLYDAGIAAARSMNFKVAADLLRRVVEKDPNHKNAWNDLGQVYLLQDDPEEAEAAFRKQIELNAFDARAYAQLGRALVGQQKFEEAIAAFQKQIELNPLDRFAHASLGSLYFEMRRYPDAATSLERAVEIEPRNPLLRVQLGACYLRVGEKEKALAAFEEALSTTATPVLWNNIAYELAEAKIDLDRAQQYAESAVASTEAFLRNLTLDRLTPDEYSGVVSIAAYWDTLGWVHFQKGNLAEAKRYLEAAWLLGESGVVGDHVGQVYENEKRTAEALQTYAQALAATRPPVETRERLVKLAGSPEKAKELEEKGGEQLSKNRTRRVGAWAKNKPAASAEFALLFSGDAKVEDVKFLTGDESLRTMADAIRGVTFAVKFPGETPMRLVRRGMLSCSPLTQECAFVLLLPSMVRPTE